ncbi:MAG TPA: hypothetical protein VGT99_00975 [Gammaproteobacteria bacterium]|nr:hypothetical protein [Gammaproteobacteria bacterium]
MDAKSLTTLGLRLLGLYLIGIGLMLFPTFLGIAHNAARLDAQVTAYWDFHLTGIFLPFIYGVALWFLAPYIAGWIAGKTEGAAAAVPLDAATAQMIAFIILGVYFFVENLPVAVALAIEAIGRGPNGNISFASGQFGDRLYTALLRALFGAALVLGSGFFTRLFRRFREFGPPPSS